LVVNQQVPESGSSTSTTTPINQGEIVLKDLIPIDVAAPKVVNVDANANKPVV
jgi:hypothetical protein